MDKQAILDKLWALKNEDKFYFNAYGMVILDVFEDSIRGGKKDKALYTLIINGKVYDLSNRFITGAEVKEISKTPAIYTVLLKKEGNPNEKILNNDEVDLEDLRVEFITRKTEPRSMEKKKHKILIDHKHHETENQFITGAQIKSKAEAPANYSVWLQTRGIEDDLEIADNEQVDLAQPGRQAFFTGAKNMTEGGLER